MPADAADACPRLIADIGGTNARFALFADGERTALKVLSCADYPSLADAIEDYFRRCGLTGVDRPLDAAIAVACPVDDDRIKLTNNHWAISVDATRRTLGLRSLQLINDFSALALSLPQLGRHQRRAVGGAAARPRADAPLALLGPGTGLGVSGLIASAAGWLPLAGEGGHVTYGAADAAEAELIERVRHRFPQHVSAERLLSGPGLTHLYRALAERGRVGADASLPTPAFISERALAGDDPLCVETLNTFCAILGTVAGNLVLTLGAQGGVYIGGGIVPRLGEFFDRSPFRRRFEQRGRFSDYLAAVPSYVITEPFAALTGVARVFDPGYLAHSLGYRSGEPAAC